MDGGKFSVEKLRSGGYETWRFKVEMLLVRENLWKYVSEAAPQPSDGRLEGRRCESPGYDCSSGGRLPTSVDSR